MIYKEANLGNDVVAVAKKAITSKPVDIALQASGIKPYVALARDAGPSFKYHIGEINNAKGFHKFHAFKNMAGDKMLQTTVSNMGNRLVGAKFDFLNGGQTFSNLTNFN